MVAAANLVEVAALVGDTARATILAALMGGQALTGSELAYLARVSRPTASEHLLKLVEARLVAVTKQGRYRYYRIASPLVARMLESIIAVAAIEVPSRYQPRSIRDDALRFARTCYDHLAGQVGVAIADALVANGHIVLTEDGGEVTDAGARFLTEFGANLRSRGKRILQRLCFGEPAACGCSTAFQQSFQLRADSIVSGETAASGGERLRMRLSTALSREVRRPPATTPPTHTAAADCLVGRRILP